MIPCGGAASCDDLVAFRKSMQNESIVNGNPFLQEIATAYINEADEVSSLVSDMCRRTCGLCGQWQSAPRPEPCEAGWSYADGACFKYDYGGPQRRHPAMVVDWFEAQSACQAEGGHLATVETKAHEHLVFQLVKQRPEEVTATGLWAWVGLWSGYESCVRSSWTGKPELKGPKICGCEDQPPCNPARAYHTNSIRRGETLELHAARATTMRRAWICSKPSLFRMVERGLCQDLGYIPITDMKLCSAMSKALLGMDKIAVQIDDPSKAFGCHMSREGPALQVSVHPDSRNVRADAQSGSRNLLCQHSNVTLASASGPSGPEPDPQGGRWVPPQKTVVAEPFGQATLAAVLLCGIFPMAFLGAPAMAAHVAPSWRKLRNLCAWGQLCASHSDDSLDKAVGMRFRALRCSIAKGVAAVLAAFHFFELLRVSLVKESVCSSGNVEDDTNFRSRLAAVHVGSLWVATVFLAACSISRLKRWCIHLTLPFVLAVLALEALEAVFTGEQALLVQSRLYKQLLWRMLLGSCVSFWVAAPINVLSAVWVCVFYSMTIPDGQVFTVGSSRAGLLFELGCNQLWASDTVNSLQDMMVASLQFIDLSSTKGSPGPDTVRSARVLFEDLLKKRTAFLDFALAEAALAVTATVCLWLLASLLHGMIVQSLRSQNTEAQLKAVTSMLDNVCDATFSLKSDGSIAENTPKLDVMLHAGPTLGGMQGLRFRDIIASDEGRADFDYAVQKCTNDDPRAGDPVYIELLASMASTLRVQLVCAQFTDLLGERCLICGANEIHRHEGEGPAQGADSDELELWGQEQPRRRKKVRGDRTAGRGTPRKPTANQGDLSDSSSSEASNETSNSSSEASSEARVDQDVQRLKCELTVFARTLKIEAVSKSFQKLFQAKVKPGEFIEDIVDDPDAFMESMGHCMEAACNRQGAGENRQFEAVLNLKQYRQGARPCTVVLNVKEVWQEPVVKLCVRRMNNKPRGGFVRFYMSPMMIIGEVMGSLKDWASQFERHRRLSEWLERPEALLDELGRAVRGPESGQAGHSLGTFTFTAPGPNAPAAKVEAEVFLDEINLDDEDFPYLLTLRHFRNIDAEVAQQL